MTTEQILRTAMADLLDSISGSPKMCGHVVRCRCAADAARAVLALPPESPARSTPTDEELDLLTSKVWGKMPDGVVAVQRDFARQVLALAAFPKVPSAEEAVFGDASREQGVIRAGVFDKAWSLDNESFNYDSLEELVTAHRDTLKAGQIVLHGGVRHPAMRQLCDAEAVLDHMANNAADLAGEYAEGFPNVSKEAKAELDALLEAWCDKHCDIDFFEVVGVKSYKLTKNDLSLGAEHTSA